MKKIKRPDWMYNSFNRNPNLYTNDVINWFDIHVEPLNELIDNAVEVDGVVNDLGHTFSNVKKTPMSTHKAYLIGIEEIKPKTDAEKLAELVIEIMGHKADAFKGAYMIINKAQEILDKNERPNSM